MKALATKQPWASLIATGRKTIEVRTWHTHYRGPLAIIASSQPNREYAPRFPDLDMPRSCVVAVVDLVDVRPGKRSDSKAAFCDPSGAFSWVLENARPTVHVPFTKSRVMTFDLEDKLVRLAR
jgi:hypothetical protein